MEVSIWGQLLTQPAEAADFPGLRCPACGGATLRVQQTVTGVRGIVRRRVCSDCGNHFTTEERVAPAEVYNEVHRVAQKSRRKPK